MICSTLLLWKKATPHIIGILPQSRNQCHTLQAVDNVMSHDNHMNLNDTPYYVL